MKKLILQASFALLCIFTIGFTGCKKDVNLYQKGIELTTVMGEMANSESYLKLMGINDTSDFDQVKAKDYDSPTRTYRISIPSFDTLAKETSNIDTVLFNELSDSLKEQIKVRVDFYTALNYVNSAIDVNAIYIASTLIAKKTYNGTISSSSAYLYTFETGTPIVVVFEPFGNKQFTATGCFLFRDDATTLSKVREIFEPFGCNIENVK